MSTAVDALNEALYNSNQPNTRKTFGTVEYALIPVDVITAVIDADAEIYAATEDEGE